MTGLYGRCSKCGRNLYTPEEGKYPETCRLCAPSRGAQIDAGLVAEPDTTRSVVYPTRECAEGACKSLATLHAVDIDWVRRNFMLWCWCAEHAPHNRSPGAGEP